MNLCLVGEGQRVGWASANQNIAHSSLDLFGCETLVENLKVTRETFIKFNRLECVATVSPIPSLWVGQNPISSRQRLCLLYIMEASIRRGMVEISKRSQ